MSAERLRALSEDDLGAAIRAGEPAWPASPPLASIVAERIRETERLPQLRPRLSLPSRRRTVLILVAATLLLAAAAVAAGLVVRIGAETVTQVPRPPTALPSRVLSPAVLGEPSTLGAAGATTGFEPLAPARLGEPSGVWVGATPAGETGSKGSRVVLAWRPTPALPAVDDLPWGAVLIEFHGQSELAAKTMFEGTGQIRGVTVDGQNGVWLTGVHTIAFAPMDGGEPLELRVTGNVLVWQRGDLTLRLET
ncbi:MAG: hypothetical protein QOI72_1241, partial [Solirubrobacterales bacterium]|nr:hypothetical protein [Solirubrobacterales bacterium]